jgi:putative transposase
MKRAPDPHYRHRFPAEIISHAVWLYHTFCLSFRDVELMLAERGIEVSYETIRRWCRKFAQTFANLCIPTKSASDSNRKPATVPT